MDFQICLCMVVKWARVWGGKLPMEALCDWNVGMSGIRSL